MIVTFKTLVTKQLSNYLLQQGLSVTSHSPIECLMAQRNWPAALGLSTMQ